MTAAGDIRKTVAPSVGMIVHVDRALDGITEILSSYQRQRLSAPTSC